MSPHEHDRTTEGAHGRPSFSEPAAPGRGAHEPDRYGRPHWHEPEPAAAAAASAERNEQRARRARAAAEQRFADPNDVWIADDARVEYRDAGYWVTARIWVDAAAAEPSPEDRARELGAEHGRAAASWYFDGNTTAATYAATLRGIEEGDPAVYDTFPGSPLSGEYADGMTPSRLAAELGLAAPDDGIAGSSEELAAAELADAVCTAYEEGYHDAVADAIAAAARAAIGSG